MLSIYIKLHVFPCLCQYVCMSLSGFPLLFANAKIYVTICLVSPLFCSSFIIYVTYCPVSPPPLLPTKPTNQQIKQTNQTNQTNLTKRNNRTKQTNQTNQINQTNQTKRGGKEAKPLLLVRKASQPSTRVIN